MKIFLDSDGIECVLVSEVLNTYKWIEAGTIERIWTVGELEVMALDDLKSILTPNELRSLVIEQGEKDVADKISTPIEFVEWEGMKNYQEMGSLLVFSLKNS